MTQDKGKKSGTVLDPRTVGAYDVWVNMHVPILMYMHVACAVLNKLCLLSIMHFTPPSISKMCIAFLLPDLSHC